MQSVSLSMTCTFDGECGDGGVECGGVHCGDGGGGMRSVGGGGGVVGDGSGCWRDRNDKTHRPVLHQFVGRGMCCSCCSQKRMHCG